MWSFEKWRFREVEVSRSGGNSHHLDGPPGWMALHWDSVKFVLGLSDLAFAQTSDGEERGRRRRGGIVQSTLTTSTSQGTSRWAVSKSGGGNFLGPRGRNKSPRTPLKGLLENPFSRSGCGHKSDSERSFQRAAATHRRAAESQPLAAAPSGRGNQRRARPKASRRAARHGRWTLQPPYPTPVLTRDARGVREGVG